LSDGTTVTGESHSELRSAIKVWKEANPDVDAIKQLVFPIEILNSNQELISVEDQEALDAIKEACKANRPENGRDGRGQR